MIKSFLSILIKQIGLIVITYYEYIKIFTISNNKKGTS